MAEIEIRVGGRPYRMSCEDGQENHLRTVAGHLDAEATALKSSFGNLPEMRLLLMAGVMVADRLEARNAELRDADGATGPETAGSGAAEKKTGTRRATKSGAGSSDLFEDPEELALLRKQAADLAEAAEAAEARAAMAEAASEEAQARLKELEERASAAETRAADAEDAAAAKATPSQGLVKALNAKLADAEARAHALTRDLQSAEGEAAAAIRSAAERVRSVTGELTGG